MRGRNPRDEHHLKIDLLEQLLRKGAVRPDSIAVSTVRDWFPTRERDLADEIVADLVSNPDAPVEYVPGADSEIRLLGPEDAREFVAGLRRDPPWFDA